MTPIEPTTSKERTDNAIEQRYRTKQTTSRLVAVLNHSHELRDLSLRVDSSVFYYIERVMI